MQKLKEESNQLYEDLKGVLYRINHLQDSFNKNCFTNSEMENLVKTIISENLKTILADCYSTLEILSEIFSVNDESELNELIDRTKNEVVIKG